MQAKFQGVPLKGQGLTARPEQAGSTGVKAWLRALKLHKYWPTVSHWTYQEMMSLNGENIQRHEAEVGSTGITMGARNKLVRCIDELRERPDILAVLADCIRKGEMSLADGTYLLEAILKSPLPTEPTDKLLWDIIDTFIKVLQLFEESEPRINMALKGRFMYLQKLINQTPVLRRIFETRMREILNMREANWSGAEQSCVGYATLPVGSESRPCATSTPYTIASGQNLFESSLLQQRAELDTNLTYENNGMTKDSGFVEDSTLSPDAEGDEMIVRLLRELLAEEDSPSEKSQSYDESCLTDRNIPVQSFPSPGTQYSEPESTQFYKPYTQPSLFFNPSYSPQILLLALKSFDQGALLHIQDIDKFISALSALNSAIGEQPYFCSPYLNLMIKSAFDLLNHHLKYRHRFNLSRRQALPFIKGLENSHRLNDV